MSDAFIQHLIDKTLGTPPPITIRHALRPDMLLHSYSQETSEDLMADQPIDVSSNNINSDNKKNSNIRNKLGKGVIPGQAQINDSNPEDAEQSKKGDGQINGPDQMLKGGPGRADNITRRRVNKLSPSFSAMPKNIGVQDKMVESQTDISNRSDSFLANSNEPERDFDEDERIPSIVGGKAQRANNNDKNDINNVTQNESHRRVEDDELPDDAKEPQKRSSERDIASPSTNIFDKKNEKLLPINNIQGDNAQKASARAALSSSERNMKGGTPLQPLQSSHSAKQESQSISKANNDTSVTISIGRIEVKAISSQMHQPGLVPKKALGLSLQEYIKLRDEGQL